MPDPALRCEGLRYRYPDARREALAGVDLRVEPGELVVLCGLSGSGKTTMLRAACGLVPHFHGGTIEGELEVAGLDVRSNGPAELAAAVGFVAQEPETQIVSTTVRAEVELPLELRGVPPASRARAVEEVALALAIADLLDRTTDTLSGGELQRVALAAALVTRPRLILLDEPTSQLDPVAGDELIGVMRRLNEESGVAILLGEHRLERCLGAADRVVALDRGAVGFDGPPAAFLAWALEHAPPLATPAARLLGDAGLKPAASVRDARRRVADLDLGAAPRAAGGSRGDSESDVEASRGSRAKMRRSRPATDDVLRADGVWVELGEGEEQIDALRGLDLAVARGERVALMGRNGAGKSTLLRAAAGLLEPARGRIAAPSGVALLPQRSADMLVRERLGDELPGEAGAAALELFGLEGHGRLRPPGPLGWRAPAPRPRPGRRRPRRGGRGGARRRAARRADPRHGPGAKGRARRARWAARGGGLRCGDRHPRRGVRLGFRGQGGPDGERRGCRRRPGRRAARRRLVLLDGGRSDPRRRRRHARAGRRRVVRSARCRARRGDRIVSWQAGIFLLLAATLVAGAVWYERSRPPSQVVALVAALAALAVAGRVVLSPVPNVVPSTDIILIAGYALGGGPGFAVGALTALVSNFWLGQGPWTPWQMAGWGMTGVMGAALAAFSGGNVKRVPLALFCAFAGLAYGALLDFSLMVTYGGEQSVERYLALAARGLPFNIAHAAGNFVLALVAGPAMVRMLRRYRSRFEFAWGRPKTKRGAAATGVAVLIACAVIVPAAMKDSPAEAAGGRADAVSWLRGAQNADGGFGFADGVASSPVMTGWATLGLEAAGVNPLDVTKRGRTPISYLRSTVADITTTGDLERTILVLAAARVDPRRFGGRDLVARLVARRGGDGSWGGQVNPTAFGVLALEAAGRRAGNAGSARWLAANQNADGGWGFAPGTASDADSTGAVLQALVAARAGAGAVTAGVRYLRATQQPGGGFALAGGGSVNAQSTAWAVQGLLAAGSSPRSLRKGGRNPLDYLASVQSDDGHYRYSAATDQTPVWVTSQASRP